MFDSAITFVGNPCYLEIEGRKILSYHGRSLTTYRQRSGLSYNNPLQAMVEMLKRRHMAPIYGGKTPLAPRRRISW